MHVVCAHIEKLLRKLKKADLFLTFGRGRVSKSWDQLQNKAKIENSP
jgi:hypothetical protein